MLVEKLRGLIKVLDLKLIESSGVIVSFVAIDYDITRMNIILRDSVRLTTR